MSKKRLHSVRENKTSESFSSVLRRFIREIRRRLEKSVGEVNRVYFVNNTRVRKSTHPFPRKLGSEVSKTRKTMFQRR